MTSCAQEVRQQTCYFPTKITSETESIKLMKKLLVIAISNITYLRAIFPESAYGSRQFEKLRLKVISESNKHKGAVQVIEWIRGCFDALEKKYLRQIMLAIYTDENAPDNAIEAYNFRFTYNEQGTSLSCNDTLMATVPDTGIETGQEDSPIHKETISLLRTCVLLTQSLDPIPKAAFLSMKLLYYDEITPADYEPPGFRYCDVDDYIFQNPPVNIKIGKVETDFHSLRLRVRTNKVLLNDFQQALCETQTTAINNFDEKQQLKTSMKEDDVLIEPDLLCRGNSDGDQNGSVRAPSDVESTIPMDQGDNNETLNMPEIQLNSQSMADLNSTTIPYNGVEDKTQENEQSPKESSGASAKSPSNSPCKDRDVIACPCSDNENDGLMMLCNVCQRWQHAVCFGILEREDVPANHACCACNEQTQREARLGLGAGSNSEGQTPPRGTTTAITCQRLQKMNAKDQKQLSLFRRCLLICSEQKYVGPEDLEQRLKVNRSLASQLSKKLTQDGFLGIKKSPKSKQFRVMKKTLEKSYPNYFGNNSVQDDLDEANRDLENLSLRPKPMRTFTLSGTRVLRSSQSPVRRPALADSQSRADAKKPIELVDLSPSSPGLKKGRKGLARNRTRSTSGARPVDNTLNDVATTKPPRKRSKTSLTKEPLIV